jgi:hypothetical protein
MDTFTYRINRFADIDKIRYERLPPKVTEQF